MYNFVKMRKRSAADILKDDGASSTEDIKITTRKRTKVQCFCCKCNGILVDPHTKKAHEIKEDPTSLEQPHFNKKSSEKSIPLLPADLSNIILPNETPMSQLLVEPFDTTVEIDETIIDNDNVLEESNFTFFSRKRKKAKAGTLRPVIVEPIEGYIENSGNSDNNTEDSEDSGNVDVNEDVDDEFSNIFEDYSHPMFDLPGASKHPKQSRTMRILIWIMKFRSNFRLPDTATEILIKFVRMLLEDCGDSEYELFPKSLYLARQTLGLVDQFVSFAACQKCHKLYKKDDVTDIRQQSVMKCSHIEFPNSATKRSKRCQTPLAKRVTLNNSISIRPELVYPIASIRQQLYSMFL